MLFFFQLPSHVLVVFLFSGWVDLAAPRYGPFRDLTAARL